MSRSRTAVHLGLTATVILLSVAWGVSAVPMQAAKPAATSATVNLEDQVKEGPVPQKVKDVKPVYPAEAAKEGLQGLFVIEVVIGQDGTVRDAKLVRSAPTLEKPKETPTEKGGATALQGDPRLAQAALEAVRQWQYEPVVKGGKPVEAKATVTVAFKLAEKDHKTTP